MDAELPLMATQPCAQRTRLRGEGKGGFCIAHSCRALLTVAIVVATFHVASAQFPDPGETFEYVGCYVDSTQQRVMQTSFTNMGEEATPQDCADTCTGGYEYFGLQFSRECFCGNQYARLGEAPEIECSMACTGDPNVMCGGGSRNSVYRITGSVQASPSNTIGHTLLCGRTGQCDGHSESCVAVGENHPFRCCSDTRVEGTFTSRYTGGSSECTVYRISQGGGACDEVWTRTYGEATAHCEELGGRLCTATELGSDCARGGGCDFDNRMVWSSGPECTPNLATGRATSQSSTVHGGNAVRAVDGNRNGDYDGESCTHTGSGGTEWWQVDLGASVSIDHIDLYHRSDCCQDRLSGGNVYVSLTNDYTAGTLCGVIVTSDVDVITCDGADGQYVTVQHSGEYITICEAEVYEVYEPAAVPEGLGGATSTLATAIGTPPTTVSVTTCAQDPGICECPNGEARYGVPGNWSEWQDVTGEYISCTSAEFVDPFVRMGGTCECRNPEIKGPRQTEAEAQAEFLERNCSASSVKEGYDTTASQIACHETSVAKGFQEPDRHGCLPCGSCVNCTAGNIRDGYVRLNISWDEEFDKLGLLGGQSSAPGLASDTIVHVFRCKKHRGRGCFGLNSLADPHLNSCGHDDTEMEERDDEVAVSIRVGFFCETCASGYKMTQDYQCEKCGELRWGIIIFVVLALVVMTVWLNRHRLIQAATVDEVRVNVIVAVARSVWQPVRILIIYTQIISQLAPVLDVEYPEMWTKLSEWLSSVVDITGAFVDLDCWGDFFSSFRWTWWFHVVFVPLGMVSFAALVYILERAQHAKLAGKSEVAGSHFYRNIFISIFLFYPMVCSNAFKALTCRDILRGLDDKSVMSVLVADDTILCEYPDFKPYNTASIVFIALVGVGFPIAISALLFVEKKLQPEVSEALILRVAGEFECTAATAEMIVNDAHGRSAFSFLVAGYRPRYYMWESVEMLRKLMGILIPSLMAPGTIQQLLVMLLVSFVSLVAQVRFWPYRTEWDNTFRAATESHVIVAIYVAIVINADQDSETWDEDAKLYDLLLIGSFIVLVLGAMVVCMAAKMTSVALALSQDEDAVQDEHGARLLQAHKRQHLGLASPDDMHMLAEFIDELDYDSIYTRAGKKVWRNKQIVSHLTKEQMSDMFDEIKQRLPKSEDIGIHFTGMDTARYILNSSQGLRCSTQGQRGGGVSICLADLVDLGWDADAASSDDVSKFTEQVGQSLWGEKYFEVEPGQKHHQKLEVALIVRIPCKKNRNAKQILDERPNVYIIPPSECDPGIGNDEGRYFSNIHIQHCLVLRSPSSQEDREKIKSFGEGKDGIRVQCLSSRDEHSAIAGLKVRQLDPTERLDDELRKTSELGQGKAGQASAVLSSSLGSRLKLKQRLASRDFDKELGDEEDDDPIKHVVGFTALVARPLSYKNTHLRLHRQLQQEQADKHLWPEDVARFTAREMEGAIDEINHSLPHAYTMAYYYCSADEACAMCKQGPGIPATARAVGTDDLSWDQDKSGAALPSRRGSALPSRRGGKASALLDGKGGGDSGENSVVVSLKSPTELGWERYGGGAWLETASAGLWPNKTAKWRAAQAKQKLEAVLVLGVPKKSIEGDVVLAGKGGRARQQAKRGEFEITVGLLVRKDNSGETSYYANAHIHKLYLLEGTTAAEAGAETGATATTAEVTTNPLYLSISKKEVDLEAEAEAESEESEWQELWSSKHSRKFWKHRSTGEKTWQNPNPSPKKKKKASLRSASTRRRRAGTSTAALGGPPAVSKGGDLKKAPELSSLRGRRATSGPDSPTSPPARRARSSKMSKSTDNLALQRASGSAAAAAASTTDGWEEVFSEKHQRKYWANRATGETSWHDPSTSTNKPLLRARGQDSERGRAGVASSSPSSPSSVDVESQLEVTVNKTSVV